jgi:hypothetical protein
MIFRNASLGGLNVVYRRSDRTIGWIDASISVTDELTGTRGRVGVARPHSSRSAGSGRAKRAV